MEDRGWRFIDVINGCWDKPLLLQWFGFTTKYQIPRSYFKKQKPLIEETRINKELAERAAEDARTHIINSYSCCFEV